MSISTAAVPLWQAPAASAPVDAVVALPGSKSLTNRLLVIAALGREPCQIRSPLHARDTELMVGALRALGTEIVDTGGQGASDWLVTPQPLEGPAQINCGLAGNVMRFVPAIAGLATGTVSFDGDPHARKRPLRPLLSALTRLGVHVVDREGGSLPFSIEGRGRITGGATDIDSSASSQFVSALLLSGARFDEGLALRSVGGSVPSAPHIAMTMAMLARAGVAVEVSDERTWRVAPATPALGDVSVEPDLSNALPFFAAALITGGRCVASGFPADSVQPVEAVRTIVEAFGGHLEVRPEGLSVHRVGRLHGADLDLRLVGELVPTATAIAAFADSPTQIRGVAHLRGHETDRLAALANEFTALGGDVVETEDGLRISPRPLEGGVFHTYDDHRLATTAALVGLVVPGILVENVQTTNKTLPTFTKLWQSMLGIATP